MVSNHISKTIKDGTFIFSLKGFKEVFVRWKMHNISLFKVSLRMTFFNSLMKTIIDKKKLTLNEMALLTSPIKFFISLEFL